MSRTFAGTAVGAALATIVLMGAAMRVHNLAAQSLWLDEAFSLTIANSTPADILEATSEDVHPPLYYFLLYGWVHIVGGTAWAGRLFSVVVSVALLVLVYAVGTRMVDRRTGLVAAGLLAVSPFQIEFAQEARMYALLALVATGATYCLWRVVDALAVAAVDTDSGARGRAVGWTVAYAALASMLTYTQVHGWFVLAAHACIVVACLIRYGWRAERVAFFWLCAMLAVAAVFLLWLPIFAVQVRQVQEGFWIPPPEAEGLVAALQKYAGSGTLLWILGVMAVRGAWKAARPAPGAATSPLLFLLPWFAVPLLVPFALSFAGSSIFLPKYTIAASVPFALLAAVGLTRVSRRWQIAAAAIIVACVSSLSIAELRRYYTSVHKDQWREMAAEVERRAQPGDVLVFHPYFTQIAYDVYRTRHDLIEAPFPKDAAQLTTTTVPYVLDRLRGERPRVWLILMSFDARKPALVAALEARFRKVERIRTFHVDAYLCEEPLAPAADVKVH